MDVRIDPEWIQNEIKTDSDQKSRVKEKGNKLGSRSYSQLMKTARYVMNMLPVLNVDALFSDESADYVSPMEPKVGEEVTIRFRSARANVDEVYLSLGDRKIRMDFEKTEGAFDYYTTKLTCTEATLSYYFEVIGGRSLVWLTKSGVSSTLDEHHFFRITPGFSTPAWAKGAVMYQIFVERFAKGDPSTDVLTDEYRYLGANARQIDGWTYRPDCMEVRDFYGGDLQGVLNKLDYLKDLGIEVIYLNPIFVSPSNHKYDTQDYDYVDPHFGKIVVDEGELLQDGRVENRDASRYICRVTRRENLEASNQLFIRLVEEIHARGMRVILDGVFNHCGSFNKWMDRERIYEGQEGYSQGAFVARESPYHDFFRFRDEHAWPYNESYDGWWNHNTLPKLNYEDSSKLTEYIFRIARKWVSPPYSVDGWRLDVAADLGFSAEFNHKFWQMFRREVKEANPNAIIIAEHYGESRSWLKGDQWDTVMNYDAFIEPVTWFFTGMEKHSDEFLEGQLGNADSFFGSMRYHMSHFMEPSLLCAMNELSNHDHSRFLTRTNHKVGRSRDFNYDAASVGVKPEVMREAVVMQMTWPGAPTLYYGDEVGLTGFTDPDNRRTYPWGKEDRQMLEFHRAAIEMHKVHPALRTGSLKFLYGSRDFIAYARFNQTEQIVAVFNNSDQERTERFSVWTAGIPMDGELVRIFYTDADSFSRKAEIYKVEQGAITLTMPPFCAIVLAARKKTMFQQKPRWW